MTDPAPEPPAPKPGPSFAWIGKAVAVAFSAVLAPILVAFGVKQLGPTPNAPAPVVVQIAPGGDAKHPGGEPAKHDPAPAPTAPAKEPVRPRLAVRVWQGERYASLVESLPLGKDEEVQLSADVPADWHGGLFAYDAGKWRTVAAAVPGGPRPLRFPDKETESSGLTGAGTELFLWAGKRDRAVTAADLAGLMPPGALPRLPGGTLLSVTPAGVTVTGSKGLADPKSREDPEGEVKRRLEALRAALAARADGFDGLAFSHE